MREPSRGFDGMVVEVTSPDGRIRARLTGDRDVEVSFAHGAYRRYAEDELGHQLARLATLMWTAYRQEYLRRLSVATETPVHTVSLRGRRADFRNALADIAVDGYAPDRSIAVHSVGLLRWEVVIRGGTVRRLDEQEFLAYALSAVNDLLTAYFAASHRLKDEIFDLRLWEAYAATARRR